MNFTRLFLISTFAFLAVNSISFSGNLKKITTLWASAEEANDSPQTLEDADQNSKNITKIKSLFSLYLFNSTPQKRFAESNSSFDSTASTTRRKILSQDLIEAQKILESVRKLETSKGELLVVPSSKYSNVFSPEDGCIPESKDVNKNEAVSCKESVLASLCKLASDAGDKNKTVNYCNQYFQEFENNLSTYKQNQKAFDFAFSQRCFLPSELQFIDKSSTFKYCLNIINDFRNRDPRFSNNIVIANLATNRIYREQGKYSEAINFLQDELQRIKIDKTVTEEERFENSSKFKVRLYLLEMLGDTYSEMGLFDKAVEAYQKNKEEGLEKQDFNLFGDSTYSPVEEELVKIQTKLGYALLRAGQLNKAEQELLPALKSLDEGAGKGIAKYNSVLLKVQDRNSVLYAALQKLRIEQGRYQDALEFAERARSTLLKTQLSRFSSSVREKRESNLFSFSQIQAEAKAQNSTFVIYSILELPFEIYNQSKQSSEQILIWIVQPDGKLHFQSVDTASKVSASILALPNKSYSLIAVSTLMIVFLLVWVFKERIGQRYTTALAFFSIAFLLILSSCRPSNSESDSQHNKSNVLDLISGTYNFDNSKTIENSKCSSQKDCLEKLYQVLIQPVEQFIPENPESHVVFLPYKKLYSVPFAALRDKHGKYLIEKNTIHLSPTIEVIDLLRERAKQNSFIASDNLVVGNPVMPKVALSELSEASSLDPLPGAEEEAKEIAQILGTTPLIGSQATESAVSKQIINAKTIHLATHGFAHIFKKTGEYVNEFTAFTFTPSGNDPSGKDDGLLTTEELYQTPLIGELAVLSACDTTSGEVTVEGVLGLANPFLISGIPSVVASLWEIPDAPTKELMVKFYENLKVNPDKARALRGAMLSTMKTHPDPVNWAGFVLIGLADMPPLTVSPSQRTQVVGQTVCSSAFDSNQLNSNGRPIKRATLESTLQGFNLRIVESGNEDLLKLDNNLVVQSASTDGSPWNLSAYTKDPFTINSDGSFEITMMVSSRSICSYSGKLEFLGDAKQKLLTLKSK
ncbi:MAG: CHAT domain-containing protein [Brasilonema octagenarum HA4186-MV1]|jgi:CHAT domain-containing protein|nr:CHAT domain-containing protein [Brasilonema octagenarum HA4186-MV1]